MLACLIIVGALACTTNNNTPLPSHSQRTHVTPQDIETSIDLGIAWLANNQNADGSWGSIQEHILGETGLAVLKLEEYAFEKYHISPLDSTYQYYDNVTTGLNFLFSNAYIATLSPQGHDTNWDNQVTSGNIHGVYFKKAWGTYETGIAMMAIAASRAPATIVNVYDINGNPSLVNGKTYKEVLQYAVDYFAWGQEDSGTGRGGWRYIPNLNSSTYNADNSVSGYVVTGLKYAENPYYGFNCIIPQFLGNELCYWIGYIQNNITTSSDFGGSAYYDQFYIVNTLKTGNLLSEMAFVGKTQGNQRVQDALNYIRAHWYDPSYDPGWGWNQQIANQPVAYYQAAYCLMKGLQSMGIADTGLAPYVADWYQDLADVIVPQQIKDSSDPNYGSWPQSYGEVVNGETKPADYDLSTAWALLTLERTAPPLCGDNCGCMDDSMAVGCNFTLCDIVTTSCSNNIITACSDNITRHCYTCSEGCECLPSDNATGLQECPSTPNSCPNPCPLSKKCYKFCGCAGWNPVTVTWTGSPPGNWTGQCGDTVTISSVNWGTFVTVNSSENCTGPCALYDVYFLADTTTDMSSSIAAIQSAAGNIMTTLKVSYPQMAFGVGNYKDFPIPPLATTNPYCFLNQLPPTTDVSAAQAAINGWIASDGGDISDGQIYALQELATNPNIGWRPGAKRIIVWFGNSPGHDSMCPVFTGTSLVYSEHHLLEHVLPLQGITVIAVDVNPDQNLGLNGDPTVNASDYDPYCGPPGGTAGQATRITSVTNGLYTASSDPTIIASSITGFIISTFANNEVPVTYQFAPWMPRSYPVVFFAACGDELCSSCNVTIKVDNISCGCGTWNPGYIWWADAAWHSIPATCGSGTITIQSWITGSPVVVDSTISCGPGCTAAYTYDVVDPSGNHLPVGTNIIHPGLPGMSFVPTGGGLYTVYENATCGNTVCPPCVIQIEVQPWK
jgi:hypothetical protein